LKLHRFLALLVIGSLTLPLTAKPKESGPRTVDSGSFGIFVSGRRVGTEKFTIRQDTHSSVISSELKVDDGNYSADQTYEMRLQASGDLTRYEWRQIVPTDASITVEPREQFLVERSLTGKESDKNKPIEQPFLMPASSVILDDFFFSQRQVLLWRYLASACRPKAGESGCELPKAKFGAIIPRQRASAPVSVAYVANEFITINGTPRQTNKFVISSEGSPEWSVGLDNDKKLNRVLIPSEATEAIRD